MVVVVFVAALKKRHTTQKYATVRISIWELKALSFSHSMAKRPRALKHAIVCHYSFDGNQKRVFIDFAKMIIEYGSAGWERLLPPRSNHTKHTRFQLYFIYVWCRRFTSATIYLVFGILKMFASVYVYEKCNMDEIYWSIYACRQENHWQPLNSGFPWKLVGFNYRTIESLFVVYLCVDI